MVQFPEETKKRGGTEFSDLARTYQPLIERLVSKFCTAGGADREDLRQEALIALYSALSTYDFRQEQVSFGLYAKICIRNRLLMLARKHRPGEIAGCSEETETAFADAADPEQNLLDRERYEMLIQTIDESLSPLEKQVLSLYLEEASYTEIAQKLGVTEKTVDNAIYRLKAKLKKRI